jgi:uncharacterized protein (DUF2252 family)
MVSSAMSTAAPPPEPARRAAPDRSDRVAIGLRARKLLARSSHAQFSRSACSQNPIDLLRASERGRVTRLLSIKHERMAASPFGFFRGAVPIMAADLACHPNTGITTQLCGDAHVANLGAFEYDLKRLATSLLLAGRDAGIKRVARRDAVLHFASRYREAMHNFAAMPVLELARYQIHRLARMEPMPAILAQAERSTPQKLLKSLTEPTPKAATPRAATPGESKLSAGEAPRRFQSHPPLLTRVPPQEAARVLAALDPYAQTLQPERRHFLAQYRPVDVAFKVVGTGSVGLRDYCIYFESLYRPPHTDPLFLQIKEETRSAYAAYLPDGDTHAHQGHRVVDGQRAMQLTSDPFLGYTTIVDEKGNARDFLVRQLNDHKATLDLKTLTAAPLLGYADLCGELFARSHARAGDAVSIAAYLGNSNRFDLSLLGFARAYADKTEQDWALLKRSLK